MKAIVFTPPCGELYRARASGPYLVVEHWRPCSLRFRVMIPTRADLRRLRTFLAQALRAFTAPNRDNIFDAGQIQMGPTTLRADVVSRYLTLHGEKALVIEMLEPTDVAHIRRLFRTILGAYEASRFGRKAKRLASTRRTP